MLYNCLPQSLSKFVNKRFLQGFNLLPQAQISLLMMTTVKVSFANDSIAYYHATRRHKSKKLILC